MPLDYRVIEIFTSEEARWQGHPLSQAVPDFIGGLGVAARCLVFRGAAGSYENGERATAAIEVLSYHLPLKLEIVLPAAELDAVLPRLQEMVTEGIVAVHGLEVVSHRVRQRLIPRQVKVRDVMTSAPIAVRETTPVSEAVRLLLSHDFNGLPVTDAQERPVGIITQNDLIARAGMPVRLGLLAEFESAQVDEWVRTVAQKTAAGIMSRPVVTIRADRPLPEAVAEMLRRNLKCLPVVDEAGRLAGMLARVDVFRFITRECPKWRNLTNREVRLEHARAVRDVMQRETQTVNPDTPLTEVIQIIDCNQLQRVAVVDAGNKLLGLISDRDVFALFAERKAGLWAFLLGRTPFAQAIRRRGLEDRLQTKTAGEVMRRDVITIREEEPIAAAMELLVEKKIKRLLVVDDQGRFQGMISRDALLRASHEPE